MSGSNELEDGPRSGGVDTYNATGGANTWGSPFVFVAEVLTALGYTGDIELDCAALAVSSLGFRYFGPDHADVARRDALVLPWAAKGTRWVNPPYSRQCEVCPGFEWHDDVKGPGGVVEPGCKAKGHRSRTIYEWMLKCAEEGRREGAGPLVALPPARTDGWWHEAVMGVASRVLFVRGRLRFMEIVDGQLVPSANASPVPTAVVEYLAPPTPSGRWLTQFGSIRSNGKEAVVPRPVWLE